jgi:hypothetical protein
MIGNLIIADFFPEGVMASRIEKTTRRVAGRVRKATKSAATATRRASDVLDRVELATRGMEKRRNIKKVSRAAEKLVKSAAVGAATMGLKRAVAAVEKKLNRRKPSRGKKALKVAGVVAVVAGAAVIARKTVKARRLKNETPPPAMEPEEEMQPGPDY